MNSFLRCLRLTVQCFKFLRLSAKFFAVLRLSGNPIETLLYCSLYTGSGRVPSGSRIWAKHNAGFGKTQNLCCWRDLDASLEAGFTKIRLFRRDFLQVDSSRCPCNRAVRSFGLTGRLMTFTRPGKDRIDKTKKLRLLTKKSGWKVSATRLFELQRKNYGNNGHLWK